TETPLARQHEQFVAGRGTRKIPSIPWNTFDRERYPAAALGLAIDAQRALALGEYSAIDLFSRIASGLSLIGAPLDLVAAATRIPSDEARHADYCLRMASLCAGEPVVVELDRNAVSGNFGSAMGAREVDRLMLEVAAMSETLAAALVSACRERATDPVVRAL